MPPRPVIRYVRAHWKALLAGMGSVVLFALSPLGLAIFHPPVDLSIDRGRDGKQASEVWLKFTNNAILQIHNVEIVNSKVWMVFANKVGVQADDPLDTLPRVKATAFDPGESQEFAVFENAHAFCIGDESSLVFGDLGAPTIIQHVFSPGSHKPYIIQGPGFFAPPEKVSRSPVYGAKFRFRVRFRSAVFVPQERSYRLLCRRAVSGDPVWYFVPTGSSENRPLGPGHCHFIVLRPGARSRTIFSDDGQSHMTLEVPVSELRWFTSPQPPPKKATH